MGCGGGRGDTTGPPPPPAVSPGPALIADLPAPKRASSSSSSSSTSRGAEPLSPRGPRARWGPRCSGLPCPRLVLPPSPVPPPCPCPCQPGVVRSVPRMCVHPRYPPPQGDAGPEEGGGRKSEQSKASRLNPAGDGR